MADQAPVVHIGENSPEEVALKLFRLVAVAEKKGVTGMHACTQAATLLTGSGYSTPMPSA